MRKIAFLLPFIFLAGITPAPSTPVVAVTGECLDTAVNYLEELERSPGANPASEMEPQLLATLQCIYQNDGHFRMGYEYPEGFASPSAIAEIQKSNKNTQALCFKIIPGFLESSSPRLRCEAARVLAYYGWPGSFKPLMQCDGAPEQTAFLLGVLGDKRAIPWVIEQYGRTDERRGRKPPFSLYHSRMVYLNTLYHVASPEQLPFVKRIIANPKPMTIKPRALKVRDRIYELYPDTKRHARSSSSKSLWSSARVQP